MTPLLWVMGRILLRPKASWSCLSATVLRLKHSNENPSMEPPWNQITNSELSGSQRTMYRYIGRDIHLANLELKELIEQEESTKSLSIDQLELRGLAMFDLNLDPTFLQQERGGYSVRLLFGGALSEGGSPRSLTDRTFRTKSFRVGKLVELGNEKDPDSIYGIVTEVKDKHIAIEVNRLSILILEEIVRRVARRSHGMYYLRQRSHVDLELSTIRNLKSCQDSLDTWTDSDVTRQIFGAIRGELSQPSGQESLKRVQKEMVVNQNLSPAQRRAVQLCAQCHPVTLIHGPPGTGKTATLAAAVVSAALNGDRVLVTAPSHAACDAVTAALAKHWPHDKLGDAEEGNLSRFCNPLRLTDFSLNKYVPSVKEGEGKYKEALNRAAALKATMLREKNRAKQTELLAKFNKELGNIRWERRKHENAAVNEARVVVCTNNQASSISSTRKKAGVNVTDFDLVCYDEAGFSLETDILPAVLASKRIIMSGDHLQLPPVVLSSEAKSKGLDVSLFEKLCRSMPSNVVLLNRQFRANSLISGWSSEFFYNSQVVADSSVASIALRDLPGVRETAETRTSLLFLDTAGEGYTETEGEDSKSEGKGPVRKSEDDESIANYEEALVVEMVLKKFLFLGVPAKDVGVISPYWSQVELLRHLLWSESGYKNVEVRTVDGYQGREKELIILSLVRSNARKTVGFLRESRRINVSLTRAKRCCIVVGNRDTLSSDPALRHFINFCRKNNALLPVKNIFGPAGG